MALKDERSSLIVTGFLQNFRVAAEYTQDSSYRADALPVRSVSLEKSFTMSFRDAVSFELQTPASAAAAESISFTNPLVIELEPLREFDISLWEKAYETGSTTLDVFLKLSRTSKSFYATTACLAKMRLWWTPIEVLLATQREFYDSNTTVKPKTHVIGMLGMSVPPEAQPEVIWADSTCQPAFLCVRWTEDFSAVEAHDSRGVIWKFKRCSKFWALTRVTVLLLESELCGPEAKSRLQLIMTPVEGSPIPLAINVRTVFHMESDPLNPPRRLLVTNLSGLTISLSSDAPPPEATLLTTSSPTKAIAGVLSAPTLKSTKDAIPSAAAAASTTTTLGSGVGWDFHLIGQVMIPSHAAFRAGEYTKTRVVDISIKFSQKEAATYAGFKEKQLNVPFVMFSTQKYDIEVVKTGESQFKLISFSLEL